MPDAILCCNDDMAFAVISVMQENGYHVPDDVRVTGFDAVDEALRAGITTIGRPVTKAGRLSVERVLSPEREEGLITMPTDFILGHTCGCGHCAASREAEVIHAGGTTERLLLCGVGLSSRLCATSDLP